MIKPTASTRRQFLQTTALASLAVGTATLTTSTAMAKTSEPSALNIPRLETGRVESGVRIYDLALQNGTMEFFKGTSTKTSGINGAYLGPTLKMRDGEKVRINVKNNLKEISTLHWHGMHLPASQDGGPHQIVKSGEIWSPEFTIKQKAASLWYHPHLKGKTAEHVWRGMAGMLIIEDDESDALELPNQYGIDDLPLVLQDRNFEANGNMPYDPSMHFIMMGMTGGTPLANGTTSAYFEAKTNQLRLRILNGSNASIYNLGFDNDKSFKQIASDGGLLEASVKLTRLELAPAERAEILIELEANEKITLRNFGSGGSSGNGGMMGGMMGNNGSVPNFKFLEIRAAGTLEQSSTVPDKLVTIDRLREEDADQTRTFDLTMNMGPLVMMGLKNSHLINDKVMKMSRIDETVKLGDTEIWIIHNHGSMRHPIHIHDVQFQILDRDGRAPPPNEQGRKDVVLVNPGETVRLIMKFEDYADPNAPFMYHCHILEHEDAGMMGQFVVV